MRRLLAGGLVLIVVGAFLAGFWPQYRRASDARSELEALQNRLALVEGRDRLASLLGRLLQLSDAIGARNFGEAAGVSSMFFEEVRVEASRANQPDVAQTLEAIHQTRDQVTTAIAQTDPSVAVLLKDHERTLRRALGYSIDGGS
jgi:hypothetical protein